jgi:predicted transcriptional regulator
MNEAPAKGATTEGIKIMAKAQYTTALLADEVGTTPKELRKFLRSDTSGVEKVGKGGRYTIELTATQLTAMKKKFNKWEADGEARRAAAKIAAATVSQDEADGATDAPGAVTEADLEEFDEAFEPTDEDLEEIELDEDEA